MDVKKIIRRLRRVFDESKLARDEQALLREKQFLTNAHHEAARVKNVLVQQIALGRAEGRPRRDEDVLIARVRELRGEQSALQQDLDKVVQALGLIAYGRGLRGIMDVFEDHAAKTRKQDRELQRIRTRIEKRRNKK